MNCLRAASCIILAMAAACARHDNATSPVVSVGSNPRFETRTEIATGVLYHADDAVADFNNDGNVDLAVGGFDGQLQILLGQGPVFTAAQSLALGGVVIWIDKSDFDSDGDIDLVVLRREAQEVNVLFNNGSAQFSPGPSFAIGSESLQVLAADATDDGVTDLLVSRPYSPEIQVLVGDGQGGFTPGQSITLPGGGQSFTMAVGDPTRDSVNDLVVADPTLNRVLVFPGLGNQPAFDSNATILVVPGGPAACAVGDLSSDGFDDIVVSAYLANRFVVITGFVPAIGETTYTSTFVPAEGRASLTTIGDVTGDGRNDLIACVIDRASVLIAPQIAGGALGAPIQLDSTGLPLRPSVVDIDRDLKNDLIVLSGLGDRINMWRAGSTSGLLGARSYDSGLIEAALAVSVDFDGNGQPEVVVGDPHETRLSILSSSSDLTLSAPTFLEMGADVLQIRVVDLDRDGRMDLVVPCRFGVKLVRNRSTLGNVLLEVIPGVSSSFGGGDLPLGASAVDLNRDGFLDLVVADYATGDLRVLRGNSTPFDYSAAPQLIALGGGPVDVVAADFTGDGISDLAVSRRLLSDIVLLRNDGAGNLTHLISIPVGASPNFLLTADFNTDKRADLVVANGDDDTITVLFGGIQGFSSASYAAGNFPSALLVEDLTGDGLVDILVASRLGEDFRVLVGNGQGGFGNVFPFPGTLGASSVTMNDLDGDGDRELLISSVWNNRVSVVRSLQQQPQPE